MPKERIANQAIEPKPTPSTRTTAEATVVARLAADAAAKIAPQEAIVIGLDAVAARPVRRATQGLATSPSASPPERIRNADQSVRAPSRISTAAPSSLKASLSPVAASREAAPATPTAA